MAFKIPTPTTSSEQSPESLFRDLRNRTVEGLLSQQADMLRAYVSKQDNPDLALELPTGSGKTLVGLLIAEWRRRKFQERCAFLCPTRQLVHQVVAQAHEKYGIEATGFVGSQRNYSELDKSRFLAGDTIAITIYNSLFNTNPFFRDVQTLIFDDAHSAENYVTSFWSLNIKRFEFPIVFESVWSALEKHIPYYDRTRYDYRDDSQIDTLFVNKLPTPALLMIKDNLISLLDEQLNADQGELYFKWIMIRDHLSACHLYYSAHSILIRPLTPPTKSFDPFVQAKQRIYMSATLGEGGDLERIFGREKIHRIPAPEGWDKQGIGRRFIIFPMAFASERQSLSQALKWAKKFGRALILTPSNPASEQVTNLANEIEAVQDFEVFNAADIETSKKEFVDTDNALAILANRYDGIDFLGDECRYLILNGLPESTNLQERFFVSRLGSAVLFCNRLKTRVTQAIGRCTRSSTDYALVLITGDKLHEFFYKIENRRCLHPEAQAEIIFGIEQSKGASFSQLEENIDLFIAHSKEWDAADTAIIGLRDSLEQSPLPASNELASSAKYEVRYQDCLWNEDYPGALSASKDALSHLSGNDLRGYRALWLYLCGNASFMAGSSSDLEAARESYRSAAIAAERLPWLRNLTRFFPETHSSPAHDPIISEQVESMEFLFERFGKSNSRKIEKYFNDIRQGLNDKDAEGFEAAQVSLGKLLGLFADNSSEQGGPDPWWFIGNTGIVFEDYTDTGENAVISKRKVLQANGHLDFLQEKYPEIKFTPVFCCRTGSVDDAARPHFGSLCFVHADSLSQWAEKVMGVTRDLWMNFPGAGNLDWRNYAATKISEEGISYAKIFSFLTATKIQDISS